MPVWREPCSKRWSMGDLGVVFGVDNGSLGDIADWFAVLLDTLFHELLFVNLVAEALAVAEEEWSHSGGLEDEKELVTGEE